MIRVEKIETLEDLLDLGLAWNGLVNEAGADAIFLSHEWITSWWRIFAGSKKLFVLVVRENDKIIGIAPLMAVEYKRFGRFHTVLQVIGWPDADCYGFIGPDQELIARKVLLYLNLNKKDWTRANLVHFQQDGRLAPAVREILIKDGHLFKTSPREVVTYLEQAPSGPDSADQLGLSIEAAKTAFASSDLIMDTIDELSDLVSNMPVFYQLHLNSRMDESIPSHFSDSAYRRFYYKLVSSLAAQKKACLVRLKSNDIPVAYGFNYINGDLLNILEVAVNPLFAGRSAERLFLLMETGLFVGQGLRVAFSGNLCATGGFPVRKNAVVHDIILFARLSDFIFASFVHILKRISPVKRAIESWDLHSLRSKIKFTLDKRGAKVLLQRSMRKIFSLMGGLVATYYVYRYEGGAPRMTPLKVNIEIKKFGVTDMDRIATFYGVRAGSPKFETFKNRFEKNADCYVALHHGFAVAMVWGLYHEDVYREHGVSLRPASDEVVISDALTSTIYRSMGIGPFVLGTMLNDYHQRGFKAVAGVLKSNMPSRRALEAYKFKHVRTDRVFKIFGIRIV